MDGNVFGAAPCTPRPLMASNSVTSGNTSSFSCAELANAARNCMLRIALDGGRQSQHLLLIPTLYSSDTYNAKLTLGQRAGLIEDNDVYLPRFLQCQPVTYQDTVACSQRGADGDDQWNSQPQCVGTGDYEDGGDSFDHFRVEADGCSPGNGGEKR